MTGRAAARGASRLAATMLLLGAILAASGARAQIDFIPFQPLEPEPGVGYTTFAAPYLRALRAGVSIRPILTVGDTLIAGDPDVPPYVLYPLPDGLGARRAGSGLVEVYVTHDLGWEDGLGGARVSRLLLDERSAGVVAADYVLDGHEDFRRLGASRFSGTRDGFLSPTFLIHEQSSEGPRRGVAAALDARNGTLTTLPWLGRFPHQATVIVPVSSGRVAAVVTDDALPGASRLWLYLADTDSDFLAGRGQLYVFRADPPAAGRNTRLASMASKAWAVTGRFVPVDAPYEAPVARQPSAFEDAARAAGGLEFVRLAGVAPDDERLDSFYLADTGDANWIDPVSGQPVTGNGRIYRVSLDPMDPTTVTRLEVVLDGDASDDLFRPRDIATHENILMIQEAPGVRGIHPSRILRYDTQSRLLQPLAVCVERDPQGRLIPDGTGGVWSSTGILDVSDFFGDDAWLLAVRAPTLRAPLFGSRGGSGQILLLRGPDSKPTERPGPKTAPKEKN